MTKILLIILRRNMHLNVKDFEAYYCAQVGSGGPYFQGPLHQRGFGLWGDIRRYLQTYAMKASCYLGKHLFNTGRNVLSDVASGVPFRESTRNRFREASSSIKKDLHNKLQHQHGSGKKSTKRKRKKQSTHSQNKRCKTSSSTSARHDIFT